MPSFSQSLEVAMSGASTSSTFTLNAGSNRCVFFLCYNSFDTGGTFDFLVRSVVFGGQTFKKVTDVMGEGIGSLEAVGISLWMWHESWGAFSGSNYTITGLIAGLTEYGRFIQYNDVKDDNMYFDGFNTAISAIGGAGSGTSPSCPIKPRIQDTLAVMFARNQNGSGTKGTGTQGTGWTERVDGGATSGLYVQDRSTTVDTETPNATYTSSLSNAHYEAITLGLIASSHQWGVTASNNYDGILI